MDLHEIRRENVDCVQLLEDRVWWVVGFCEHANEPLTSKKVWEQLHSIFFCNHH